MKPGDYTPKPGESDDDFAERVKQGWERERLLKEGPPKKVLERVKIATLDRALPPPLLLDRLDPRESTILYGPGGAGKGSIACSWIKQLVMQEGLRVLILDYENHEGEWARRLWSLGGATAGEQVLWAAPLTQKLGPIWEHADAIRDACTEDEIDYIVIDSAVFACAGADPSKAEVAIEFGAALQVIGKPSLALAHVTKLHDPKYPFGSAFWHNATRVSWSLMQKGDDMLMVCRKANNYRKPSAQTVVIDWIDNELRDIRETPASVRLEDRIAELLVSGPMSPADIVAALNDGLPPEERVSRSGVGNALQRSVKTQGQFTINAAGEYLLRHPVVEED